MKSDLKRARIIRRTSELRKLVNKLKDQPLLAVDTESNSLYAYYEQVCLVQLSYRAGDQIVDVIVDPLEVDDMSPLGDLLADPAIEIIFHAAEYDVITMKRDFGYTFSNIFDTMLAARICGWPKTGLGNILGEQFGIAVDKKHQRANWSRRPLPEDQLRYAQMDTHYLPALRDRLVTELERLGRLVEARETFAELPALLPAEHNFDPDGYWRIHDTRNLRRSQMGMVRELYLLRDQIAQRRDWPPFKIFGDKVLVKIAEIAPRHLDDLYDLKGLNARLVQRDGQKILDAVARGRSSPPPAPPRRKHAIPSPEVQQRYEALHEWRKQRAAERGVESDVIVSRDVLWALARQSPTDAAGLDRISGLGPWRKAEYGAELLAVLAQANGEGA